MTYKSEAEITAAFINDGWSKNTSFTELSFDDAREIGKYFVDLMLKGTKLFRMNICGNVYDDTGKLLLFDIASTSEAKRLIETYCENEFQNPADFSDIRNIGLAYTTITEEEIEIQVKRDLVDELYKTAYKRYREKYPNKDFVSIPNFLDSLWFSIEGELNRNGYDAARKYVEEADLIVLMEKNDKRKSN